MQDHFQMSVKKSNGNIHVTPKGTFNGNSAWELVHLLHGTYRGKGRIFIDTRYLKEVCPFGCDIFKNQLDKVRVPPNILYFKGRTAFALAPSGCKVIVTSERVGHKCKGNCANCKCKSKKRKNISESAELIEKIAV